MSITISRDELLGIRCNRKSVILDRVARASCNEDFTRVAQTLCRWGYTPNDIRPLLIQLLRFLSLKIIENDEDTMKMVPSQVVDTTWRALLLSPKIYMRICTGMSSSANIIEYTAVVDKDDEFYANYKRTLRRYADVFGIPASPLYWPSQDGKVVVRRKKIPTEVILYNEPVIAIKSESANTRGSNVNGISKEVINFRPAENPMKKIRRQHPVQKKRNVGEAQLEVNTYFANYVDFLQARVGIPLEDTNRTSNRSKNMISEDFCFLCKDGGDLVECEQVCGSSGPCFKVYHESCLAFKVTKDVKKWVCPRHYCDGCGDEQLIYACIYCPMSVCDECKGLMATRFDRPSYVIPTFLMNDSAIREDCTVQSIICHSCIKMAEKCIVKSELDLSFLSGAQMFFSRDSGRKRKSSGDRRMSTPSYPPPSPNSDSTRSIEPDPSSEYVPPSLPSVKLPSMLRSAVSRGRSASTNHVKLKPLSITAAPSSSVRRSNKPVNVILIPSETPELSSPVETLDYLEREDDGDDSDSSELFVELEEPLIDPTRRRVTIVDHVSIPVKANVLVETKVKSTSTQLSEKTLKRVLKPPKSYGTPAPSLDLAVNSKRAASTTNKATSVSTRQSNRPASATASLRTRSSRIGVSR